MNTMETELQKRDSELYAMYMRSLEIAQLKWLPNIAPRKDSYNSYPHIRGVIGKIDRLLYEDEEYRFSLNCSELYILLCAILMHDIGKGAQENPFEKGFVSDHALDSHNIITEHWADLGLPTKKVAEIVADICRFHACPDKAQMKELYTKYYIDHKRTEPVRGRILGALLFLGDHMDNTFTRVVPSIFKDEMPLEIVGKFRSRIADVRYDRKHKVIREILDRKRLEPDDIYGSVTLQGELYEYLKKQIKDEGKRAKVSTLYVLSENVMDNEKEVALIKDELNIMGMPVKKWLIEYDEHLFQIYKRKDREGNTVIDSVYALEPIINLDYCLEVLKGICMLAGGIFARQFFQYRELVNFIREEESRTYMVECAVRRLSLLLKAEENCGYVIYCDENNWSFSRKNDDARKTGRKQKDAREPEDGMDQKEVVYNELKEMICERVEKYDEAK